MWVFFAFAVLNSFSTSLGVGKRECTQPTLLYDSLKCTPVFSCAYQSCPSKYDCSNIEQKAINNEDKCYFDGKTYSNGQQVKSNETKCRMGCTCTTGHPDSKFKCPAIECAEWINGKAIPAGCHHKYDLENCCSVGLVCNSTSTCVDNGKNIQLGKKFDHPSEKCSECVCADGFKVQCRKRKCVDEISHQRQVYSFCAPSYISSSDCCPFNWICPEKSDEVKRAKIPSKYQCKFGTAWLDIGDKFSRTKGKGVVTCECLIPPYLTCIQNYDYPLW